ncbi:UNVERIFIED_CONTAM: hypothetical protein GTU68_013682, partial [Idotea baltica]|nr:hypothetical protein [Idotea baltica]
MPFDFAYVVKDEYSGNDYAHKANSDGEVVKGEYHVLLPDGRVQIVTYIVNGEDGFKADVSYDGEARPYVPPSTTYEEPKAEYSQPKAEPEDRYQKPKPTYEEPKQKPKQTNHKPKPTYEEPKQTYQKPK